jgi:ATP-dependent metalloprotease
MSGQTSGVIDKEVKEILEKAYNNAKTILTTHDKELHALANALLEHETLSGAQIKKLLAQLDKSDNKQKKAAKVPQKTPAASAPPQSPPPAAATAAAAAAAAAQEAAAKAKGVAGTAAAAQEAATANAKGVAGVGS